VIHRKSVRTAGRLAVLLPAFLLLGGLPAGAGASDEDAIIADTLAEMLRAGRTVVSNNQARINDPNIADKGLTGAVMVAEATNIFKTATGKDPAAIDPGSREGRLLGVEIQSIAAVIDANQGTINAPGVGFKAFIPAVFGRLVTEEFGKRAKGEAEMKVTAPRELVRNRKALPDKWEEEIINQKLLATDWPKGQPYSAMVEVKGRQAFRVMAPEYYAASCLTCHGPPKGQMDVTGYPKEGRAENDLGGVISIVLYR
jgi:hypothetical protein